MPTVTLFNAQQGHAELRRIWDWCKPMLIAGHRLTLIAREAKRSLDQNAKFHAICGDFAKSDLVWFGKRRTARDWKTILVSGHAAATGEGAEVVLGIEGELVALRESTADMSKARGSSLIEYAIAFAAAKGVALKDEHAQQEQ